MTTPPDDSHKKHVQELGPELNGFKLSTMMMQMALVVTQHRKRGPFLEINEEL
jgi:hypothetical protein